MATRAPSVCIHTNLQCSRKSTTLPPLHFYYIKAFVTSALVFFLWQHHYKAGEGPGEGGAPAERDLCGLCTLSVAYPAGQPRTGAAHRRYRCWIVQAVCGVMSPAPCRCRYSAGCLNDGCVRSCRCWQESHYFAHKLGVCQSLIKSALPFIHLVTSLCFVFFMNLSTYWVLFLDVVFLNISVSKSHQMSCGNVKIIGSMLEIFLAFKSKVTSYPVAWC